MFSQNQGDSRAAAPPSSRETIGDAHLSSMPGDHVPVWADARPHQSYSRDGRTDRERERITGKRDWTERGPFPRNVIPAGSNGATGSTNKRRPPGRHGFFGENGRYGGNILRGGDAGPIFAQGGSGENGTSQWKFERDGFFTNRPPLNPGFNGGTGVDERRLPFSREGYSHGGGEGRDGSTVLETPGRPFHPQSFLEPEAPWERERGGRGKDVPGGSSAWDRENRGGERTHGKSDAYRRGTVGPFVVPGGGFSQLHDVGREWGNEKELEGRVDRYGRDGVREGCGGGWSSEGMATVGREAQVLLPSTSADRRGRERGVSTSGNRNGFLGVSNASNGCLKEPVKAAAPVLGPSDAPIAQAPQPFESSPPANQQQPPTSPSGGTAGNKSITDPASSHGQSPPKRARLGWGQGLAQFEKKKAPSGKEDVCDDSQGPCNLATVAADVEDSAVAPGSPSWDLPHASLDAVGQNVEPATHLSDDSPEAIDGCDSVRSLEEAFPPCTAEAPPTAPENTLLCGECSETRENALETQACLEDGTSVVPIPGCEDASATATPEVVEPARVASYDVERACADVSDLQNDVETLSEQEVLDRNIEEKHCANEETIDFDVVSGDEGLVSKEGPSPCTVDVAGRGSPQEAHAEEDAEEVVASEILTVDSLIPRGFDVPSAGDGMLKLALEEFGGGNKSAVEETVVQTVPAEEVVPEVVMTDEAPCLSHSGIMDDESRGEEGRRWTKEEILLQMEKVDLEIEQLERKLSTLGAEVEVAEAAMELRDVSPDVDHQPMEEDGLLDDSRGGTDPPVCETSLGPEAELECPLEGELCGSIEEAVISSPVPCCNSEQDEKTQAEVLEMELIKGGSMMEDRMVSSVDAVEDETPVLRGMQQVGEGFDVPSKQEHVEEARGGEVMVGVKNATICVVESSAVELDTMESSHSLVMELEQGPPAVVKVEPGCHLICEGTANIDCNGIVAVEDATGGLDEVEIEVEAEKVVNVVSTNTEAQVREDCEEAGMLLEKSDVGPAPKREFVDMNEVGKRWHWMDGVIEENKKKAKIARAELQHLAPHMCLSSSDKLYTSPQEAPVWWENVMVHSALEERMRESLCQRRSELKTKEQLLALKYRAVREIWRHEQLQGGVRRDRFFKDKLMFRKAEVERPAAQRSSGRLRLTMMGGKGVPGTPGEEAMIVPEDLPSLRRLMSEACTQPIVPVREELKMPEMILDSKERGLARFIDRNSLVEDPVELEILRQAANPWTPEERKIFLDKFAAFNKNFTKIASFLEHKTTADCVEFYYRNQKGEDFERIRKRQQLKKRRDYTRGASYLVNTTTASSRREAARIEQLAAAAAKEAAEKREAAMAAAKAARQAVRISRTDSGAPSGEAAGEDSGLAQSSGGSPDMDSSVLLLGRGMRRQALSEVATGVEQEGGREIEHGNDEAFERRGGEKVRREGPPRAMDDRELQWTPAEENLFVEALSVHGKDFKAIALSVPSKTQAQCRAFFSRSRKRLGLDNLVSQFSLSPGIMNGRTMAGLSAADADNGGVQLVDAGWRSEFDLAKRDCGKDEERPSSLVLGDVSAVEEGHGSCHGQGPGLSGWLESPALRARMEDVRVLGGAAKLNMATMMEATIGNATCRLLEEEEGSEGVAGGGDVKSSLDGARVGSPGAAAAALVGLAVLPLAVVAAMEGPALDLHVGRVDGVSHHVSDVRDAGLHGSMRSKGESLLQQSLRVKDESDEGVAAGLSLATGGNRDTLTGEAEMDLQGDIEGSFRGGTGRSLEPARDVGDGRDNIPDSLLGASGSWRELLGAANTSGGGGSIYGALPGMRGSSPLTDFMLGTGQALPERSGVSMGSLRGASVEGPNGRPLSRGGLVKEGSILVPGNEPKQRREPTSWTQEEKEKFAEIIRTHGKDWTLLQENIPGKSLTQIKTYFQNSKAKLGFSALVDVGQGGGATSGSVVRSGGGGRKRKAEELEISSRPVPTSGGGASQVAVAGPGVHQNGGSGPALADEGVAKNLPSGGGLTMGLNPSGPGNTFGMLPGRNTGSVAMPLGSVGELTQEQQTILMQQLMQSFMKNNGGYPPVGHGHPGYMFPLNIFPPAAFSAMGLRGMQQQPQQMGHPLMAPAPLMPIPMAPFRRPADLGLGPTENGESRGVSSKDLLLHGGSGRSLESSGVHVNAVSSAPVVPQPRLLPASDVKLFGQSLLSQPTSAPSRSASPAIPEERASSQGGASQPATTSQAGSQQSLASGSMGFGRDIGLAPSMYRQGSYPMMDPRHPAMWPGLASTSAPVAARQNMSWDMAAPVPVSARSGGGSLEREDGGGQVGKRGAWDGQDQDDSHHGGSGSKSQKQRGQAQPTSRGGSEGYGGMHGDDSAGEADGSVRTGLELQHGEMPAGSGGLMTSLLGRGKSDHGPSKQAGLPGRGAEQGPPVASRSLDAGGGLGQSGRGRVPVEHNLMMAALQGAGSHGMLDLGQQHGMVDWSSYGCMPEISQWGMRREASGGEGGRDTNGKQAAFDLLGGLGSSLGGGVYGEGPRGVGGEDMHHTPASPLALMGGVRGQGFGGWLEHDPRLQQHQHMMRAAAVQQAMHHRSMQQQQQRGVNSSEEYMKPVESRDPESTEGGGGS